MIGTGHAVEFPGARIKVTDQANTRYVSSQQLLDGVSRVRAEEAIARQADAAQKISDLVFKANLEQVDDAALHELASLLNHPKDNVRFWTVLALAAFGKRSAFAVPKMLELLPMADCERADLNSSAAIRGALPRIGAKVPRRPDCRKLLTRP
jgi:hypothetical protein